MKYTICRSARVEKLTAAMDWRTLLDQACCPNFRIGHEPEKEYGAVFFHAGKRDELQRCIAAYRRACNLKPLVTTDMEAGPGQMITDATRFPSMMACGRCNNEELAYRMGQAAALEGREVGFNWSLAPCVDLAADRDNPIVSTRSAGADPERVIRITGAYIRGMQEHAMAATVKHFPGDGFGSYDQHLTTAVNPLSMPEWQASSGRVFRELINGPGPVAVMPGHIALPAFDVPDEYLKLCPPATLSRRLMVDLLRRDLGFAGMIVSDAIEMGGIVNFMNYYDACAAFWENGGDCLLFPTMNDAFYDEMARRIDRGTLTLDTLRDRVARILGVKEQMGLLDGTEPTLDKPDFAAHRQWAREMAEGAVEIVRDRAGMLPVKLPPGSRLLHLIIAPEYEARKDVFDGFTSALQNAGFQVTERVDPGPNALFDEVYRGDYALIVCSLGGRAAYGTGSARLYGPVARNMMKGWMRLGTPTVFVSHFHPYAHDEFDAAMDTVINTCGSTADSFPAVMRIITGA